jgi:hypothetical protein
MLAFTSLGSDNPPSEEVAHEAGGFDGGMVEVDFETWQYMDGKLADGTVWHDPRSDVPSEEMKRRIEKLERQAKWTEDIFVRYHILEKRIEHEHNKEDHP